MEKRCPKCKQVKSETEFHKDSTRKNGLYAYCKECKRVYLKEYYRENSVRLIEYAKNYYHKNKRNV